MQTTQKGSVSTDLLSGFLALGFVIGFIVAAIAWNGFVLKVLWGWFMVPTFGLPTLNIPQALGIAIVAQTFMPTQTADRSWVPFLTGALTLVIGWLVHLFM